MTSPGKRAGYGPLSAVRHIGIEACVRRNHPPGCVVCTVNIQSPTDLHALLLQHITLTYTYFAYIKGACAVGQFNLASALTIDCHTGSASMVTPDSTEYRMYLVMWKGQFLHSFCSNFSL